MDRNSGVKEDQKIACYHCGEQCVAEIVEFDDKEFCCDGCKLVYDLLRENSMCTYYNLNEMPGVSPGKGIYSGKYDCLNEHEVNQKLISFTDGNTTHVTFFVPKIHCSSCIWLLENLHRLNAGIVSSSVNFVRKEATIIFSNEQIQLAQIAELMANIGYEPLVSLNDLEKNTLKTTNRNEIIKIGLAGFCFGNIMMLSFPEYFSVGNFYDQKNLQNFFGYLNLTLALPVFFYSASSFFVSAWKSLKYRYLNIDTPIALAILVTFSRSVYEILGNTGAGYLDSMTGIVFFMLIGRWFQNRTYETLSFERDYKSYFPVGVTVKKENGNEVNIPVSELKKKDVIIIRNNELIPSDSILLSDYTYLDYSFITGESKPVKKIKGELIYAGGKQLDGAIELEVVNLTSQSYLTQLWNKDNQVADESLKQTFVDKINKYFTIMVLSIAAISSIFWMFNDATKALNALTAVLIVACPCGLLLTTSFANGNIVRILGRNKFYLKNAGVIDKLNKIDTIVFDKTGTITHGAEVNFVGPELNKRDLEIICALAAQSTHPLNRKLHSSYATAIRYPVTEFEEITGKGIKGLVDGKYLVLGSQLLVTGSVTINANTSTKVFLQIDGVVLGYFSFLNTYRPGLSKLVEDLRARYRLKLISGDNDAERGKVTSIFGDTVDLYFNQKPEEKMSYVEGLQASGATVMMIGDGLNDAGALKQSDLGIAVSDDTNNFSPACDAIMDGEAFARLPDLIGVAKAGKKVIVGVFIFSLTYNIVGLFFAVKGVLSPVIAAILMPASTISIVLLVSVSMGIVAWFKKL